MTIPLARIVIAAGLLVGALAPAAVAEKLARAPATSKRAADIVAIRAVGERWRELYEAGRFADIPELYTVDTAVMPRGRPRIDGRDAMRRQVGGLAAGRKVTIALREREIGVSGNYGWYIGDFTVTYAIPGGSPTTEHGRSLIIYRRDSDARWRIHRDIDSPAPVPIPAATATAALASRGGVPSARAVPRLWNPADRTTVTECDRLTASHYDRTRLARPVDRDQMNVPEVIRQCEADLARYPGDPRLLFQLGRVSGYANDPLKTRAYREAAAAAGNHNAIFLLGFLDWTAAKDDAARCAAAGDMKLAADRGNYSGQITVATWFLEGRFAPCGSLVSRDEAIAYVKAARPVVDGFFETRLAEHLLRDLAGEERR